MAEQWRDDEHGRRSDDGRRGNDQGYGYGAREGGGSERAYRDRADQGFGDREGRFGRSGSGPTSDDRSPRFGDDDGRRGGFGQADGREADYGNERARGGFPSYGDRVGYLDRGVSGEPGYEGVRRGSGGGADFGSNSGAGYAGQRRGDSGNAQGGDFRSRQGGFHEREAGSSYGTRGWETDDTPTWRQINRNPRDEAYGRDRDEGRGPDYAPHFAGYGGAQMYDGGANAGRGGGRDREDRLGGLSASRDGYSGRREDGYGGAWGAFGQSLSGPGRREDEGPHRGRGPRGWQRSDERIREDAHERLTDDPMIDAGEVSIEVQGGEVTLNGTVDDRMAKRRAEDIVERISGVSHVQNNLRVRGRQWEGAPVPAPRSRSARAKRWVTARRPAWAKCPARTSRTREPSAASADRTPGRAWGPASPVPAPAARRRRRDAGRRPQRREEWQLTSLTMGWGRRPTGAPGIRRQENKRSWTPPCRSPSRTWNARTPWRR